MFIYVILGCLQKLERSQSCVVLEMYTGEPPWPFADSEDLMPQLLNGNKPEIPQSLPWDARQFLKTCFARNPDERGSAEELLKHPFLRNVSDQKKVSATGVGESHPISNGGRCS
ncbi:hypothetical protein Bca52824_049914 [Brassica carinata]|uniref:Protein kinase domain-containing protein n=1 Tax=Brassica carinata TaxID=52824 RepID=A0A8X7US80_BRACI|nr:hypothetical protein Bca52824_049914 [Brassica carinata]